MKRFDVTWLLGLMLFSTEALAKRRRSGGSAALGDSDLFGWVALAVFAVGALAIVITYADTIGKVWNIVLFAVAAWLFVKWNIDVAWCVYAELVSPERLSELCVAEDGVPFNAHWRYGMYLLLVLLYGALLGGAIVLVRKKRRERRSYLESALMARLPIVERHRLATYVAECEAMIDAIERQSKRRIPTYRIAKVVELGLALDGHRHAVGRDLTPEEMHAIAGKHRIWE